jgi:hypothetical protein
MATARESISIGFTERTKNGGALDYPTVEHNKLLVTIWPPLAWFRQVTLQLYSTFFGGFQCCQSSHKVGTKKIHNTNAGIGRSSRHPKATPFSQQGHRDLWVSNGKRLHLIDNVSCLSFLSSKKFFPRRNIEE